MKREDDPHEAGIVERERPAGLPEQRLSGFCGARGRGCDLPAGDEAAAASGELRAAGLPDVFQQRGQGRLLRHGGAHKKGAAERHLRFRRRRAPARGARHHGGVRGLLPCVLLYAELAGRAEASPLSDAVGGRPAGIPLRAGSDEACGVLRRSECGARGDRPEESQDEPLQPRLFRRGAREDD